MMDHTLEYRKQNILDLLSDISSPEALGKVEQFLQNLRKKEVKPVDTMSKYIKPLKEKTDLKEIAKNQYHNLEFLENYDGNIFEGEDIDELTKMLRK